MTVFSGVSLPGVTGGHAAEHCFLTGTPHPERGGFRNGVSLDQFAAEQIGNRTRYPSLTLAMTNEGGPTLSYTRSGAPIAPEKSPRKLFEKLFVQGKPDEVEANVEALRQGRSMLDFVGEQRQRLNRSLSEGRPAAPGPILTPPSASWNSACTVPRRGNTSRSRSSRRSRRRTSTTVASSCSEPALCSTWSSSRWRPIRSRLDHALHRHDGHSQHHASRQPARSHRRVARPRGRAVRRARTASSLSLTETKEEGQSLLDRTMVLYGTCMGSANSHSNVNLPVLLAGGGFKHGQHLAFDTDNNYPLTNLYVSMLQRLGIETSEFSTGKSTMRGLERA